MASLCTLARALSTTVLLRHHPPGSTNLMVPSGIFGDVGNLSTISYMASDPSQPSPELQSWATLKSFQTRDAHRFGVGVCFVNTSPYPEGTYWIDVGYYMGAIIPGKRIIKGRPLE